MHKDDLRRQIRQTKRQFSQQQLEKLSLPVIARLKKRLMKTKVILAYYSLPDEVNTHDLVDELVAEGKTVLLPKVMDDETMEIRRYTGKRDLVEGVLHLHEPMGERFTDYGMIDVAVIPGLAFDAAGHRLGRGRGYYDRFLKMQGESLRRIGICFGFQMVEEVPTDENDVSVDEVIS